MSEVKTIDNVAIGLVADVSAFSRDVVEAAESVSRAFQGVSPEITPTIDVDGGKGGGDGASSVESLLASVARQAATIGPTMAGGFSRVVGALERMVSLTHDVANEARRASLAAWSSEAAKRQADATTRWQKGLSSVETGYIKIATAANRIRTLGQTSQEIGVTVGGLFGRGRKHDDGSASGPTSALAVPGRIVGRTAGRAASGAMAGLGQAVAQANGQFSIMAGILQGGIAGAVAAVVVKLSEWVNLGERVKSTWAPIKRMFVDTFGPIVSAMEPAGTMLHAVGIAAQDLFISFAEGAGNASSTLGGLVGGVAAWVRETVDGGGIVLRGLRAVAEGVALAADGWQTLSAVGLAMRGVFAQWAATALDAIGLVVQGLDKVAGLFGQSLKPLQNSIRALAESQRAKAGDLIQQAGEAWIAPSARNDVMAFFDDLEKRSQSAFDKLHTRKVDMSWLTQAFKGVDSQLQSMATQAEKLWEKLLGPRDKLAEQFNELDKLQKAGMISDDDHARLKSKAAGEFLGSSKNPAALEAGSREARSAVLEWRNSQRDPLKELPNIQREQLAVARNQSKFLQKIAEGSNVARAVTETTLALGSVLVN